MFKKIVPIFILCLGTVFGVSDKVTVVEETNSAQGVVVNDPCAKPCEKPAAKPCATPCPPKPSEKPAAKPCATPCPPKPCEKPAAKPCATPCPPKPSCNPPAACCWEFNPCNPKSCADMNCGGTYLSADFLYWRSENHGFSYAYEALPATPSNLNVGKVLRIDSDWSPAFRVGLGWNVSYDFWDVLLNYTWYNNRISKTKFSTNGYYRTFPLSQTDVYGAVSASSRFMMNMGDLEFGRLVNLTKSISLRPYFGVKGGTLHQTVRDRFSVRQAGPNQQFTFNGRNNFWGIGPRAGFNADMIMAGGFGFIGKMAAAMLYGNTKIKTVAKELPLNEDNYVVNREITDSFSQLVPTMQLALGFQWQTCFWCEQMFFKMSASWETNYFWDQFNLPVAQDGFTAPFPTTGNQSLSMEGLTVNFELDF